MVEYKVGQSTRKLARKFGVSNSTIHDILTRNNVIYHKRKRAPQYTAKQLEKIPICCRALRVKHFANRKFIIVDDESYFTETFRTGVIRRNVFFHTMIHNIRFVP